MTLLELLLALAGTAVVGTAVTAMLVGVTYGTSADKDMRSMMTRQMALRARLEAEVRESSMVLDQGVDYVVLWGADTDESGTPNKAEIRVIEYDAATSRVMRYAPADGIADVQYTLADDFRAMTDTYKGDATFPGERWADNVSSMSVTLDDADPQLARLVALRVELVAGDMSETVIATAAVRNEVAE